MEKIENGKREGELLKCMEEFVASLEGYAAREFGSIGVDRVLQEFDL